MRGSASFEANSFYHIVNHAVGIENLFNSDDNYMFFLKRWSQYMPSVCSTYAYCLLPNHIHFLIKTHSKKELAKHAKFKGDFHKVVMQQLSNLLNSYTKAYNRKYERRGALWLDFTKRFPVVSDAYLIRLINYIHQNPVNHGFCDQSESWKYSSFNIMPPDSPLKIIENGVIEYFGGIQEYRLYHLNNSLPLMDEYEY